MTKVLITGISGFVGSHLAEYLVSQNFDVSGFAHPDHAKDNLKSILGKIDLHNINLLDFENIKDSFKKNKYDLIFHLAAFSSPPQSFKNPQETLTNNIIAQVNLLETIIALNSEASILIVGSADEYGDVLEKNLPIVEETELKPTSPYAVSKLTQDYLGLQYHLSHNLKVVRVRPFNHIGPRQSEAFVVPSFAKQIAQIEKTGKEGTINVGSLDTYRDFTDVRDMVKAYLLALEKGDSGDVYNIGSGQVYKIEEILNILLSFTETKIKVKQKQELVRKKDIKLISCDFSKFKIKTGWNPEIPINKTLLDTIEYERNKIN